MNEGDGFRVEAALQFGFVMTNDDGDQYVCTEAQLIAFAKACERKGRAEASSMAQRRAQDYRTLGFPSPACALDSMAGSLDMLNAATDAELAQREPWARFESGLRDVDR